MDKELKEVVRVAKNNGAESKYLAGISFEKEEKFREAFRWFLKLAISSFDITFIYIKKHCIENEKQNSTKYKC